MTRSISLMHEKHAYYNSIAPLCIRTVNASMRMTECVTASGTVIVSWAPFVSDPRE